MNHIFCNGNTKKALGCPTKTASSTIEAALSPTPLHRIWNPCALLTHERLILKNFEFAVLVRNPVDWYVSGYRYALWNEALLYKTANFTQHLLNINEALNIDRFDHIDLKYGLMWLNHCVVDPVLSAKHIGITPIKYIQIESNLELHVSEWLDVDFKMPSPHNTNTFVHYPKLTDTDKNLIKDLSSSWAKEAGYDIDKCISEYEAKVNTL